LTSFGAVLVLLLVLRSRWSRFEIKTGDMIAAALPVGLLLLVTGKLKMIEIGDFKLEAALKEAVRTPVAAQVTPLDSLPVDRITAGPKGGADDLERLREQNAQALTLTLARSPSYYRGDAIAEYLRALGGLQYVFLLDTSGRLAGFLEAGRLREQGIDLARFAEAVNADDRVFLAGVRGYLPAEAAIPSGATKKAALKLLENQRADALPALGPNGEVAGVVNRARLTASILLDISDQVSS
jgi:hypothetical protein